MSVSLNDQDFWKASAKMERKVAPGGILNIWRKVIYNGRVFVHGISPDLIHEHITRPIAQAPIDNPGTLVEFGCGDCLVAHTVTTELAKSKKHNIRTIGIDADMPTLLDKRVLAHRISTVNGDLLAMPFTSNTFDAGILRFVLTFIPPQDLLALYKELHRVMKKGSVLVILNDGVFKEDKAVVDGYDLLFNEARAQRKIPEGKEREPNYYMPSCETVIKYARIAGFDLTSAADLTKTVWGYISPEILGNINNLDLNGYTKLKRTFKACKQQGLLPFEPKKNSLRVLWPKYTCVLSK